MLPEVTSKHVGNATELTCLIPIKPGFVPTFDTWSYASRLRVVFKVLHALRQNVRESRSVKPVLDIVDAAGTVHGFTWAVVLDRFLMLNVVFDRPWEPYIRVVWRDLGPLLDLFLCNCEGFVPSINGYEGFAKYVRDHQIDAAFFYPATSLTIDDQRYLAQFEKAQRDDQGGFATTVSGMTVKGPRELAAEARKDNPLEARVQWMLALEALFGLRTLFPELDPATDPGHHEVLRRAALALLTESRPPGSIGTPATDWFDAAPRFVVGGATRELDPAQIQGGILTAYNRVSHACMLLARIEQPVQAREFVRQLAAGVTTEANGPLDNGAAVNVAFSYAGLQRLGVSEAELLTFPKEFREGMEARAGLLGDVRENHPDRWKLPRWNVDVDRTTGAVRFLDDAATTAPTRPPVRTSGIDLVITLHARARWDSNSHEWDESHPLFAEVTAWCERAFANGVRVVSMQPLRRFSEQRVTPVAAGAPRPILAKDHFGLVDGISQPVAVRDPQPGQVNLGELLVGFDSQRDPAFPKSGEVPGPRESLRDQGSFLVVRKLRQNVGALKKTIANAPADLQNELLDKMVGRRRDGSPLHEAPGSAQRNDFDFKSDPGRVCPFHSHIRRGNPRLEPAAKSPIPVIARRGLSYGPRFDERPDVDDRGMMFMAYNASIAEQFEIIQRWMSGGNTPAAEGATGTFGGQPDPLLGLPDPDGKRTYRFVDSSGNSRTVDLGATAFVTLEWGLYLFTPSIPALQRLAQAPVPNLADLQRVVAIGEKVMSGLTTKDQWAAFLEGLLANQSGHTAAVYAAIRQNSKGVRRTPYGVVVASHELGMKVLSDDAHFSVREYQKRFGQTVGEGYLGMDSGDPDYETFSAGPNQTLQSVKEEEAFKEAFDATVARLEEAMQGVRARAGIVPLEPVIDKVLGQLARLWFDIPEKDEILIALGGQLSKDDRTLRCPASFIPASRYVFSSPHPRPEVEALAKDQGSRLLAAVHTFVAKHRAAGGAGLSGKIAKELFALDLDDDRLARVLLGLVFGFVPTVYGNALAVLGAWLNDESFWRLQQAVLAASTDQERAEVLRQPLHRAMLARPVPGLLHREVVEQAKIGDVTVEPGERIVLAMGGMTQELLAQGPPDRAKVTTAFGGDRTLPPGQRPTHACPGTHIAMGVLTGILAGILTGIGVAAPTPSLVTVRVSS